MKAQVYDSGFFHSQAPGSTTSAQRMVPLIHRLLRPASVLDVGCGTGTWAAEWLSQGVEDVKGLDGDYIDRGALLIPPNRFEARDLATPFDLGRRFDLVTSLEVAEHIPSSAARIFVDSLARHSDLIVFSAAIPGQGGYGHVNEQWPSYWAELFGRHGLYPHCGLRNHTWADEQIEPWYRQNILVFASRERAHELGLSLNDGPLDVVHPDLAQLSMRLPRVLIERLVRTRVGNRAMRSARQRKAQLFS